MTKQRHKSERIMAWITPQLKAHLDQIVRQRHKHNPKYRISDLVRDALRAVVDDEAEILGSRAHQVRTVGKHVNRLQQEINRLMAQLAFTQQVLLQMLAITSAVQLDHQGQKVTPQQLITMCIKAASAADGQSLQAQLQKIAKDLTSNDA